MEIKLNMGKILALLETMAKFPVCSKSNRLNSAFISQGKRMQSVISVELLWIYQC